MFLVPLIRILIRVQVDGVTFSPGRKAIRKNKRVYSPCPCKLVYLGVFVVLGRCGVSVGGEMSHKKNRTRSVFPNGIGTGLPEGNNMAVKLLQNASHKVELPTLPLLSKQFEYIRRSISESLGAR